MYSQTQAATDHSGDERAVRAFHHEMTAAWNRGDGEAFAAPFADDADFVAFEGTHLKGRPEIAAFHQRVFDTVMKGTRLVGEVKFVHFPTPSVAVMHAVATSSLPGSTEIAPSRDSMQLFVAVKSNDTWRVVGLLNARKLSLEDQAFWDDFQSLPPHARNQVSDSLRAR